MSNIHAVRQYVGCIEEMDEMLTELDEFLSDMGSLSPDDVDWPTVGTMNEARNQLRQLCEFLGIREAQVPA